MPQKSHEWDREGKPAELNPRDSEEEREMADDEEDVDEDDDFEDSDEADEEEDQDVEEERGHLEPESGKGKLGGRFRNYLLVRNFLVLTCRVSAWRPMPKES